MSALFANIVDLDVCTGSKIVSNSDLEKIVDTNNEWIIERTGIHSRPICDDNEDVLTLSINAAKKVLSRHEGSIDAVIAATTTSSHIFPNLANRIASHFQIDGFSFDISAACSGYLYALTVAQNMMESQKDLKNILVISSDTLSRCVDWKDRNTCILFGDAGSATLVSKQQNHKKFFTSTMNSCHDPELDLSLVNASVNQNQGYIQMNGKKVFKNAVAQMSNNIHAVLQQEGLNTSDVEMIIPHQANKRILDAVSQKVQVSPEKVYSCMENFGNTSAASIPLALKKLASEKEFDIDSKILLTAFVAGFTSASLLWNLSKNQKVFTIKK